LLEADKTIVRLWPQKTRPKCQAGMLIWRMQSKDLIRRG
jgi:hypothetical protein